MNLKNEYRWQEECLAAWEENDCRGIVQAVTGSGKTILAVKAIKRLDETYKDNLWTAVVVPTRALMMQWNRILRSFLLEDASLTGLQFQVFVINSARYRLARQILDRLRNGIAVFLIADECHHYTSSENRKIFEFIPYIADAPGRYFSLGLSATVAARTDSAVDDASVSLLKSALGKIVFRYSCDKALKEGTIAEFRLIQIALHFHREEEAEYTELSERMNFVRRQLYSLCPLLKKDPGSFFSILQSLAKDSRHTEISCLAKAFLGLSYQRKKLVCMAENRIFCVRHLLQEIDVTKKVIIFSERIEQAETLFDLLKYDYGSKVGKYHSKAGKQANQNTLERFRNSEILILITCKALDEGIDVPDAEIGIILSGTGIERQRLQRLGRILRKNEGKETACLYYLYVKESMEEKTYVPLRREIFQTEDREYSL